ncbi:MAG TPA: acetate--CoA ligase family protein [Ignavibacteria bacterium]|nr:acetate--CoA ligase family protein [Ignavibacteria bacterium]
MRTPLDNIFYPCSIAVIGASSKEGTLSFELISNLVKYGYKGCIYPVNPKSHSVHSIKAYANVTNITDEIDLAVIMVPKDLVLKAIDDCRKKKIHSVVVITAGFKETGKDGARMEEELVAKIKKYRMRLIGPNCMGLINTHPDVKLNCTFVQGTPVAGGIGFVSQSGALGAAILKTVQQNDIGLAQFVSIGNKADVSGNTVLEYWWHNDDIKVITLYLESFGNPRMFMELTREITKTKPVIAIKSARTKAGMKAASSHTGALASSDAVVSAFLEQSGVIRVNTTDEMFDIARAFDMANLPSGNRVGILTNAGGPAILAVDECANCGLIIPELSRKTQAALKKIAPQEASVFNPVDVLPPANAKTYAEASRLMLDDENIDSLIVVVGPPLMLDTLEIASSICDAVKGTQKTVMLVMMSQDVVIPRLKEVNPVHPPIYRFPENAARAISKMLSYRKWKERPEGVYNEFDADRKSVKKIINKYRNRSGVYLNSEDVSVVLKAYGLPIISSVFAKNTFELIQISDKIKYPVVLKAVGKKLIHKSDMGGVEVDIHNPDELLRSADRIIEKLKGHKAEHLLEKFMIQPYVSGGVETILGITKDAMAGSMIMFGLGGIFVEVFKDVNFKLVPINNQEADAMIRSIKSFEMLSGVRGRKAVDLNYIRESLLRLSQLSKDFPEFSEIDLNPFVFFDEKARCCILDSRIRLS